MIPLLLLAPALAAGLHAGIPVHQRDLGEPAFQSAENGWTAPLASGTGFVRVFVGRDEATATDWFLRQRESFSRLIPDYTFHDQAAGDGVGVLLFRDGNVGVMVRSEDGAALAIAESLASRIVDGPPSLSFATLQRQEDGWVVVAPGAAFVQTRGAGVIQCGNLAAGGLPSAEFGPPAIQPCGWATRPDEVTVWDNYGRATVIH